MNDQGMTFADFFALQGLLSPDDREQIIERAIFLLQSFYAHLPLKQALFGQDPVRRMRILKHNMKDLTELTFHYELLNIFIDLHDLHTRYVLPMPYQSYAAYLPFSVQAYYVDNQPYYMVSELLGDPGDARFQVGVDITHFNGVPIHIAVAALQRMTFGANPEALHARAVQMLTLRHLAYMFVPDTDHVLVRYTDLQGGTGTLNAPWNIAQSYVVQELVSNRLADPLSIVSSATDRELSALKQVKQSLGPATPVPANPELQWGTSHLPGNFAYRSINTPQGDFGYIRIWTFENTMSWPVPPVEVFVSAFHEEFLRILSTLPPNGLILDVRGNGGGVVPAGEGMLQFLSPSPVQTCRYHFHNSAPALALCEASPDAYGLKPWIPSISQGLETGSPYSHGFTFEPFCDKYNDIGQKYYGPVVLIADALCYSTTDMVIAAFRDNNLGTLIGTDGSTGAGGANVWDGSAVLAVLYAAKGKTETPLPQGADITVALRRSTRVGKAAGEPIEDVGVAPDTIHRLTRNDLLTENADLIACAVSYLQNRKSYNLQVSISADATGMIVTTQNLSRIDIYVDGRPVQSTDVGDGTHPIPLTLGAAAKQLDVKGYLDDKHVASARLLVTARAAPTATTNGNRTLQGV